MILWIYGISLKPYELSIFSAQFTRFNPVNPVSVTFFRPDFSIYIAQVSYRSPKFSENNGTGELVVGVIFKGLDGASFGDGRDGVVIIGKPLLQKA